MITVGIIDIDTHARQLTKKIVSEYHPQTKEEPIQILFETDKLAGRLDGRSPDVLLVDIHRQDPLIVERVKNKFASSEILILTKDSDLKTVRNCFRYGAVGYLLKQTCLSSLVTAIYITLAAGSFVSPSVNRALIQQSFSSKRLEGMLTARELQIANGIVEGLSYKMIAQKYVISLDTVRIYIKRIYRKLHINSKGELIAQLRP